VARMAKDGHLPAAAVSQRVYPERPIDCTAESIASTTRSTCSRQTAWAAAASKYQRPSFVADQNADCDASALMMRLANCRAESLPIA